MVLVGGHTQPTFGFVGWWRDTQCYIYGLLFVALFTGTNTYIWKPPITADAVFIGICQGIKPNVFMQNTRGYHQNSKKIYEIHNKTKNKKMRAFYIELLW